MYKLKSLSVLISVQNIEHKSRVLWKFSMLNLVVRKETARP